MRIRYKDLPAVNLDNVISFYIDPPSPFPRYLREKVWSIEFKNAYYDSIIFWGFDDELTCKEIYNRLLTITNVRDVEYMPVR